jgi:hypothetical protein
MDFMGNIHFVVKELEVWVSGNRAMEKEKDKEKN